MPRRRGAFQVLGYALGAAFGPIDPKGLSPNQGHSPGIIWPPAAGHSHRLTFGGKAEGRVANNIEGKPPRAAQLSGHGYTNQWFCFYLRVPFDDLLAYEKSRIH